MEETIANSMSIIYRILTNRQKTHNLRSFFPPNYGKYSHSATGSFCSISNTMQYITLFYSHKSRKFCF